MNIIVYSKPSCVQCNATIRKLDKEKIEYVVFDISQDHKARDYVQELGYRQAPVCVIKDQTGEVIEHWSGFQPGKIDQYTSELLLARV